MKANPTKKPSPALTVKSTADLRTLQRRMANMVMQPLTPGFRTTRSRPDGSPSAALARTFIKPNDRLTSLQRVELYNRQYWFRLIDSMYEDFPGVLALLGQSRFDRMLRAYLHAHPSRSYTLRGLGEHLPRFIAEHRTLAGPRVETAIELATLEWAQIVAFDSEAVTPITPADLRGKNPASIRLALQPFITLLTLSRPLDDYLAALNREPSGHGGSSNTLNVGSRATPQNRKKIRVPKPTPTALAVHRHEHGVFRKRLHPCAFALLIAIQNGRSLARALDSAFAPGAASVIPPIDERAALISEWFAEWGALGWLTRAAHWK